MTFDRQQLDGLLSAVCDGVASKQQQALLADLLATDDQILDEYLRWVDLHGVLATEPALAGAPEKSCLSSRDSFPRRYRRSCQCGSCDVLDTGKSTSATRRIALSTAALVVITGVAAASWVSRTHISSPRIVAPRAVIELEHTEQFTLKPHASAGPRQPSFENSHASNNRPAKPRDLGSDHLDERKTSYSYCGLPAHPYEPILGNIPEPPYTSSLPARTMDDSPGNSELPNALPALANMSVTSRLLKPPTLELPGPAVAPAPGPPSWRRQSSSRITLSTSEPTFQWRHPYEFLDD